MLFYGQKHFNAWSKWEIKLLESNFCYLNLAAEALSAFTTGSSSPERNLTIAPPPVHTYENLSAMQYLFTAAMLSPPPITENASSSAIWPNSSLVPDSLKVSSNIPQGPLTNTVPAPLNTALYSPIVLEYDPMEDHLM
jgi:hypothetical protein